jgi:YHS domain-containing protein
MASFVIFGQDVNIVKKKHTNVVEGVAIQGYDAVAYFKQNKAVKGKKEFSVVDAGITYFFSTIENKEAFKKSPDQYEPQYGGWCAYAMGAKGEKVEIDPGTFKISNNKLYLFYNKFFNNTLKDWNKDETNLSNKADMNWKKIAH